MRRKRTRTLRVGDPANAVTLLEPTTEDELVIQQFDISSQLLKQVKVKLSHELVRSIAIDLNRWQKLQAQDAAETLKALRGEP